jgi:transposase InsO family protein
MDFVGPTTGGWAPDPRAHSSRSVHARVSVSASDTAPRSITVDNGTEFASRAMDFWAYTNGVHLNFIRPGWPVENGYVESFNGSFASVSDRTKSENERPICSRNRKLGFSQPQTSTLLRRR